MGLAMGLIRRIVEKNPFLFSLAKKSYGLGLYRILNPLPPHFPQRTGGKRRLIVDMTVLSNSDYGTGIQRVGKKIYGNLRDICANSIDLAVVYATADRPGYFIARPSSACGGKMFIRGKEPLAVREGDVFLGLDYVPDVVLAQRKAFKQLRQRNIPLFFLVHDLLPVQRPEWFSGGTAEIHNAWLRQIAAIGTIVCVSQTVSKDLGAWLAQKGINMPPEKLRWIHNGCDLQDFTLFSSPCENLLPTMPYFLSVSTLEPRKGHGQTLAAFEELWRKGHDIALVFAGKEGWLMQKVCTKIREHPELGKRLFWHENCDDDALGQLYKNSLCVLSASEAEGFGLSLIEGASFGKPLLLRDIPVFREIAGDNAFYFQGHEPHHLAAAIGQWLDLQAEGNAPSSSGMKILNWAASAGMLLDIIGQASGMKFPHRA